VTIKHAADEEPEPEAFDDPDGGVPIEHVARAEGAENGGD